MWLTVPVKTCGKFDQNICDVEIDNSIPWRRKHWKTINLAYQKAPYFHLYKDFLADAYTRDWKLLVDLNEYLIRGFLSFLNIEKKITRSSSFQPQGKKTELLIDICRKTHASGYLSGTGNAHQYVNVDMFRAANLIHVFQNFTHPIYPQIHGEFKPKMAIIDLLCNCGPDSERYVKQEAASQSV